MVSRRPRKEAPESFTVDGTYHFRYQVKAHRHLPHVVKFSGGRSSGMLLFSLLDSGLLDAGRGDVVVFNNTSAEHASTYAFSRQCKEIVEREYGIPFFWIEAQTYEDARSGEWTRCPSYRLVNAEPASPDNPGGYSWRGEVYEELISLQGFLPNQFRRICTTGLKLNPTRAFLAEWLAGGEGIPRRGHYGQSRRIDLERLHKKHRKSGGGVPFGIFEKKKEFIMSRPHFRPAQSYAEYSGAFVPFTNKRVEPHCFGDEAVLGYHGAGAEYLAFIGLRYDEAHRVIRVWNRSEASKGVGGGGDGGGDGGGGGGKEKGGHEGESVYMPLHKMFVTRDDVDEFWARQKSIETLPVKGLSNCTYCFLKGAAVLKDTHKRLSAERAEGNIGTPHDIQWWVGIEKKYSRDLLGEGRKIRSEGGGGRIGFFGTNTGFSYEVLAKAEESGDSLDEYADTLLPCDCTE